MIKPSGTPSRVKKRRKKPSKFSVKSLLNENGKNLDIGLAEEAILRDQESCQTNPNFAIICNFLQQEWDAT
jgi:hypothetical protein